MTENHKKHDGSFKFGHLIKLTVQFWLIRSSLTPGLNVSTPVSLKADRERTHSFLEESGWDEIISTHRGLKVSVVWPSQQPLPWVSLSPSLSLGDRFGCCHGQQRVNQSEECGRWRLTVSPPLRPFMRRRRRRRKVRDTAETVAASPH